MTRGRGTDEAGGRPGGGTGRSGPPEGGTAPTSSIDGTERTTRDGWATETTDGDMTLAGPGDPTVAELETLSRRERRRRLRQARRGGRQLFRGRLVPRTVRAFAILALVAGVVAGATAATVYAIMDARVTRAENAASAANQQSPPEEAELAPGAEGGETRSSILLQTAATGEDPTVEGVATAVLVEEGATYWLTAYELVAAATVSPPAPIRVTNADQGPETLAEAWTWDQQRDLGLLATRDLAGTPRTWGAADLTLAEGELLSVSLPAEEGPPAPVTVSVVAPLTAPRGTFTVSLAGTTIPLGAPVITSDGLLVGIVVDIDGTGPQAVATVSAIRNACGQVLRCDGVG